MNLWASAPIVYLRFRVAQVRGSNFGLSGAVTLDFKPCAPNTYNHTVITCFIPVGEGACAAPCPRRARVPRPHGALFACSFCLRSGAAGVGKLVTATVAGQSSNSVQFAYAAPTLSGIR